MRKNLALIHYKLREKEIPPASLVADIDQQKEHICIVLVVVDIKPNAKKK